MKFSGSRRGVCGRFARRVVLVAAMSATPVFAGTVRDWTGSVDNNWSNGTNWSPTAFSLQTDDTLRVFTGAPVAVSVSVSGGGSVLVSGPGSATFNGPLNVGTAFTGSSFQWDGRFMATDGAAINTNHNVFIGSSSGWGEVILAGSGSTWNAAHLVVGSTAYGSMLVDGRATLAVGSSGVSIGSSNDGVGEMTVRGVGTGWTNTGSLTSAPPEPPR